MTATIKLRDKAFKILLTKFNDKTLIKPSPEDGLTYCSQCKKEGSIVKGYHKTEYEVLFDFGDHCERVDPNKIRDITSVIHKILDLDDEDG